MANLFNSIRIRPPKYNRFNLSHDVKLTAKFGKLVPILCRPTLPGDIYKLSSEVLVRMAPMLAPIMTKVNVYTHFFFVPNRLLWDDWKDFITGGEDGNSNAVYPRYDLKIGNEEDFNKVARSGSLLDYLGFPTYDGNDVVGQSITLDALPFRAYQLIYNEYYRDQNLMEPVDIQKDMGGIIEVSAQSHNDVLNLRNRCWSKDYFTSALPFAQRGDEVELPLQGDASIKFKDGFAYGEPIGDVYSEEGGGSVTLKANIVRGFGRLIGDNNSDNNPLISLGNSGTETPRIAVNLKDSIVGVDLSSASSATINELRRAIKAQEFLELAARGGSRYIEQIYSYFGVRSSDARLQRPEFLGGGKSPVMISDVLQTSQSTENSAQANPAGHGVSVQRSHSFKYRCEEHGYIIGILSVMPKAAYMQGYPRLFRKSDRLDYYWPQFAHLGEQEILSEELYYDYSDAVGRENVMTFGYTPRYAEYKVMQDSIHGDFRNSLSFWHMGRIFGSRPALNRAFLSNVEDAANRVFNVVDENVDKLWINIHHEFKALMKMPKYGTPYM